VQVQLHASVDGFRAIAEPVYRRDPIVNTIELTLLGANKFPDDSLLMTVSDNGTVVGAAIQTPPYPLACNAIPLAAMGSVVADLAARFPNLAGVRGVRNTAVSFADSWRAVTGRAGTMSTEDRLYRLGTLRKPSGVAGSPRLAAGDDRALLVEWVELFFEETFSQVRDEPAGERFIDRANQVGGRFVVWTVDAAPVSMAMLRAPAAGVSRIGPVFTPRHRRGRGYGSAITAAAADLAHRRGTADVVLFADLANPTSNAIYQNIGFEPVVDSAQIDFATVD
jgi:predicted GNAT family acetyltransferase